MRSRSSKSRALPEARSVCASRWPGTENPLWGMKCCCPVYPPHATVRIELSESTDLHDRFHTSSGLSSPVVASRGVKASPSRPVIFVWSHCSQPWTVFRGLACQVSLAKRRGAFSVCVGPPSLERSRTYWPETKYHNLSLRIGPPAWTTASACCWIVAERSRDRALE